MTLPFEYGLLRIFLSLNVIQGTACVVLGGLLSALKLIGGTLSDHTFLFLGVGEVNMKYIFKTTISYIYYLNIFVIWRVRVILFLLLL